MDFSELHDDDLASIKLPPHSIEAEQSVLGGLMLDNSTWDTVSEVLTEDLFYRRDHRLIFRTMEKLINASQPVDVVTVQEELDRVGELEAGGGLEYLVTLARNTPSASNIRAYSEIVRDRALLRQMIAVSQEISDSAFNPEGMLPEDLLNDAERKIFQIAESRPNQGGPEPVNPLLKKAVERIDTLFNNAEAMTGVSTGFDDLDESTTGLQPSDLIIIAARPSMGKCIISGSRLVDPASGALVTIDELVERKRAELLTLDNDFKLKAASASDFVDDGIKPVFRVRTATGREISTTLSHPFLTGSGWRPLGEIGLGERVAVPRVIPVFGSSTMPEYQIKTLAYFIGDGGTTQSSAMFTNGNSRVIDDFTAAVSGFPGMDCKAILDPVRTPSVRVRRNAAFLHDARLQFARILSQLMREARLTAEALAAGVGVSKAAVSGWCNGHAVPAVANFDRLCGMLRVSPDAFGHESYSHVAGSEPNAVVEFLTQHKVWNKTALEKVIPEAVYQLSRSRLSLFINRLFACDGSAFVQANGQGRVSYSSSSRQLIRGLQHLLLRFGIISKIRAKQNHYPNLKQTPWELEILDQSSLELFIQEIGIFGKEESVEQLSRCLANKQAHSNRDSLPLSVNAYILERKGARSWRDWFRLANMSYPQGFNPHLNGTSARQVSRKRAAFFARLLQDNYLLTLSESDVYWDEIVAIDSLGDQQVYDLTVPETHNFVAEDFCVHNTTFAMNLVENALMLSGRPVLVFSLEMPADQLVTRMLSSLGRINQTKVRTGQLEEEDWPRLTTAVNMLRDKPLYIDDTAGISPNEMRSRARRIKREHGDLALIMIDYLQLMQIKGTKMESRTAEISEISRSLKALAKEMECPVVALSQLNRALEQRPNKRPVNSDLRESGAIEQDADVIMFIYRDEVYNEDSEHKGIAEIIIGKQRNGPIGTARLAFIGKYTRFENLAAQHYEEYGGFDGG